MIYSVFLCVRACVRVAAVSAGAGASLAAPLLLASR